jgi:hypothetical protein
VDLNELKLLTTEQRQRYLALEAMFGSEGWKYLMENTSHGHSDAIQRVIHATNWDAHVYAKAQADVFMMLLKMEEANENEYVALATVKVEEEDGDFT